MVNLLTMKKKQQTTTQKRESHTAAHLWVDFSNAMDFGPVQFSLPLQLSFSEINTTFTHSKHSHGTRQTKIYV